jgi:hypothetical protein
MKGRDRDSQENVRNALEFARVRFLERDLGLIQDRANERSVTHRVAVYLEERFPDWNVDCEYNRQGLHGNPKVDPMGRKRLPDIVVHRRGTADNLVVIEAKPSWASKTKKEHDREKLIQIACKHRYKFAFVMTYWSGKKADLQFQQVQSVPEGEDW